MADERLRALERRWKETGDESLGARYLLERSRLGLLPERGLELAAWLELEPARVALREGGQPVPEPFVTPEGTAHLVRAFVNGLRDFAGLEGCLRVGLAIAERVWPDYRTLFPDDTRVRATFDAVAMWLGDRGVSATQLCLVAAAAAREAEEVAWRQFQAWGIEFSHAASTFGRPGELGGDDLEELVHDAGQDDFEGFNLCHDQHFNVAFFQVPRLAAQLAEAVGCADEDAGIELVIDALDMATEESWEVDYEDGHLFGADDLTYWDDPELFASGPGVVEVTPEPLLPLTEFCGVARAALLDWVLGVSSRVASAEPAREPAASQDDWEAHLTAFPSRLEGLGDWCARLALFGQPLGARVAAAAARRCLARWEAPDDPRPREAVAAALAWSDRPGPEQASVCERACDAAVDAMSAQPRIAEVAARAAEVPLAGDAWPEAVLAVLDAATEEVSLRALRDALHASFEAWELGLEPA